jgi:sec-independent protein translocase protein TatB
MFGVGLPELLLLAVVAVLAFGPDKMPKFARQAGRMVRQIQDFNQAMREELRQELGHELADLRLADLELADLGLEKLGAMSEDSATQPDPQGRGGSATSSSGEQRQPKGRGVEASAQHVTTESCEPSPEGPTLCSETPDGSPVTNPSHVPMLSERIGTEHTAQPQDA